MDAAHNTAHNAGFEFIKKLGEELSHKSFDLPPFPENMMRVREALNDPDISINSVAQVEDLKDFEFHLILSERKGSYLKELYRLRDRLKLNSTVKFVDTMPFDDLKKYISESYAVVIPSYSEGFCFVAAETMALDIPIVSSGRGALNEVITGDHIHFSPFNVTKCTMALKKAIDGEWDHTEKRKFLLSDSVDEYEKLYQSLQ